MCALVTRETMRFITVLSCVFRIYCAYCVVRTLNIPPEDILKANGVNGVRTVLEREASSVGRDVDRRAPSGFTFPEPPLS
uniref:Secreted protein n=1 Tax=Ascaris lumbricoides TaxID=6252 RepID=A0A0M3I4S3_ASCLU